MFLMAMLFYNPPKRSECPMQLKVTFYSQRLSIAVRDNLQVDLQEGTTEMLTTILTVSYIFQKIMHNSTMQKSPY